MKILIIEDEVRLCEALAEILKKNKYSVDAVHALPEELIVDQTLPGLTVNTPVRGASQKTKRTPNVGQNPTPEVRFYLPRHFISGGPARLP